MSSSSFYQDIPPFNDFRDITALKKYHRVPDDWWIIISDVKGSTQAINEGRYKDVNFIGASSIIAVLNALKEDVDIPFVFGGDGASFIVPPHLLQKTIIALQATRNMARENFKIDLRVGAVSVSELKDQDKPLLIAKYNISENIAIAMFKGGGLSYADKLIKDQESKYDIQNYIDAATAIEANFHGLECRWSPIKTQKGDMLTLLIQAQDAQDSLCYDEVLKAIARIYGTKENYRPNNKNNLKISLQYKNLRHDINLHNWKKNVLQRCAYILKLLCVVTTGKVLFKWNLTLGKFNGDTYREELIANTDFQKFDDLLRMVIDSTPKQTKMLKEYLENQYLAGKIYYGTHIAVDALMTCLVFNVSTKKHLHFIDGGSGGYTLAAKQLKDQKKRIL